MRSKKLSIIRLSHISSPAPHCAFTDLIALDNDLLLCCFRKAQNHVSNDGVIEIVLANSQFQILTRQYLRLAGADLRDPKLSRDINGRIWLLAYAKTPSHRRMISWFSDTGYSWSSSHNIQVENWWLWRTKWHEKLAWGLAYNRGKDRVDLYQGHLGKRMNCYHSNILSLEKHGLGYPNESDIYFDQDNNLWALVRRDADSFTAQLGYAAPPYTRWQWRDLKCYIGGPAWLSFTEETMLVSGRQWTGKRLVTSIWLLTLKSGEMEHLFTLPSAGDNSYPGLVADDDTLYVSYYSSHIDRQTRVYLASLSGLTALRDKVEQR